MGSDFPHTKHKGTERGGRHALLSQPGELGDNHPLPSQTLQVCRFNEGLSKSFEELYPQARPKAKGGIKK